MTLLYFILMCYGLTQILVYGSIFNSIRPKKGFFGDLLKCPMCTGLWVGVFVFLISPCTELITFEYNVTNILLCGWLSSGTSYILCTIFGDEGINVKGN
tara:strand:+ start:646 stop:942 length:297 start_codon:yes stop_codon:yes gene_type:complete